MSHTSTGCLSFRKSIWTSHWDSYAFLETVSCSKLSCLLEMEDPSLMKSTCNIVKTTSSKILKWGFFQQLVFTLWCPLAGHSFLTKYLEQYIIRDEFAPRYTLTTLLTLFSLFMLFSLFIHTYAMNKGWITSFHRHSYTSGNWQSSSVLIPI